MYDTTRFLAFLRGPALVPQPGEDPYLLASIHKGIPVIVRRGKHVEVVIGLLGPLTREARNALRRGWRAIDDQTRPLCRKRCAWHKSPGDSLIVDGRELLVSTAYLRAEGLGPYLAVLQRILNTGWAHERLNYHLN